MWPPSEAITTPDGNHPAGAESVPAPERRPVLHLERCLPLSFVDGMVGAYETPDISATETSPPSTCPLYSFEGIDVHTDSALDASEFRRWSESPAFAFYMQREVTVDPSAPAQTGALDREVLIDALYAAWDIDDDQALDRTEWDAATRVIESVRDSDRRRPGRPDRRRGDEPVVLRPFRRGRRRHDLEGGVAPGRDLLRRSRPLTSARHVASRTL